MQQIKIIRHNGDFFLNDIQIIIVKVFFLIINYLNS